MRPPEGDDVSARARLSPPGGALRSTRLVRPARSIGRAPCLLPGARPSALLATRRELQKQNFRRGLPRILALGWAFRSLRNQDRRFIFALSQFEKLSDSISTPPRTVVQSGALMLWFNLRRSIATPERRLWRLNRLTFPAPPTPSTKQTGEPPTDSHETKGRFPLVRRVSGRTREAAARSRRRRVEPARLPEPDLAAGFVLPTATGRNDSTPDLRRDSLEHVTRSHGASVCARAIAFVAFSPVHPREPTRLGALYTQD